MLFRCTAALSRTLSQALVPCKPQVPAAPILRKLTHDHAAGILILILCLYTGFALPTPSMLGWISWVRYLNPYVCRFNLHNLVKLPLDRKSPSQNLLRV